MRWQVELTGHRFDLEDLPRWFTDPDFHVVQADQSFYLEAAQLEVLDTGAEVHSAARSLVSRLNGIAKLNSPSFRDVQLGSAVRELGNGQQRQHVVLAAATIEARSKVNAVVVRVGDAEPDPPSPGSLRTDGWMRSAIRDDDVCEAIDLWAGSHDWVNLYKVFEIVRARANIVEEAWASDAELTLFKWTANHQDAAGSGARHARMNSEPPAAPMQLSAAETLLGRILASWIDSMTS